MPKPKQDRIIEWTSAETCSALGLTAGQLAQHVNDGTLAVAKVKYGVFNSIEVTKRWLDVLALEKLNGSTDDEAARARLRWLQCRADSAELELRTRRHELVGVKEVTQSATAMMLLLRNLFLGLAPRMSARLAHATSAAAVHELLDAEVRRTLSAFSAVKLVATDDPNYDAARVAEEAARQYAEEEADDAALAGATQDEE